MLITIFFLLINLNKKLYFYYLKSVHNMIFMKMDTRIEILKISLLIEASISHFLGGLLSIKDVRNSISLGNKSTALSFQQKINLLIDIGALNNDTKSKFQTFMEIRNQLIHNIEAKTFVSCFSFMEGKEKYILKTYPQDPIEIKEIQLKKAVECLSDEVFKYSMDLIKKLKEKWHKESKSKINKLYFDTLKKSINYTESELNKLMENEIRKGKVIPLEKFKEIGTIVSKLITLSFNSFLKNDKP